MPLDRLPSTCFGPTNLVELVRHRALHQPDAIAFTFLVDGENEQIHLTNKELDRQARAIGAWLESHDLVGQRALLLYPAGLEFITAFIGCLYAGVTACPVYPPRRNRSLTRIQIIADDADAKVALTTDTVLNRVESLVDETVHLKDLPWLATCHVPEGIEQRWQLPDVREDTLAFIQYTSGSTGEPKGVMLTHSNLIHNSALISYAFEHTRSGKGVFWLPSYHDMGLIGGILQPLYMGRPNVLMSPMSFLTQPYRWLSAISRFGGTTSGCPNFGYDLCVRNITAKQRETLDLSCWEIAFNGAEPIQKETIDRFSAMFEPCGFRREAFYPCFGLAEATLIVSGGSKRQPPIHRSFDADALESGRAVSLSANGQKSRNLVGSGQMLPGQKIAVVDPEKMTSLPSGQVGEIWVRGPSVAEGYWGQPEATETTFHAFLRDTNDGPYLRTGDLGFVDEGELFVTGRIKDLIIVRGRNIYPQDIERTVQQCHQRLRPDCGAVFSVDQDHGTERLVIVNELHRRNQGNLNEIFDGIHRAISVEHELRVDAIILIKAGSIPKTSSGKIQRLACRQAYLDGTLAIVDLWHAEGISLPSFKKLEESTPNSTKTPITRSSPTLPDITNQPTVSRARKPASTTKKTQPAQSAISPNSKITQPIEQSNNGQDRTDVSGNGQQGVSHEMSTAEIVLTQVRKIAQGRANGLTLDTQIIEIGLDSVERMEILAAIEERFGGRFPEETLVEMKTCREVVEAVEKYLCQKPRARTMLPNKAEIPEAFYRPDLFPERVKFRQGLNALKNTGVGNPAFISYERTSDQTWVDGHAILSFAGYDYLGASCDPTVQRAVEEAISQYGTSVSSSRLVSGQRPLHEELERALAKHLNTEDALTLVGGHATRETVIGHLIDEGDWVLHDIGAHDSIVQGAVLSGARRHPFAHHDWNALDEILDKQRHEYRRVLIVIEGLSILDGKTPDLPRLIELKKRHRALLLVDEAHSLGVLGATGGGLGELFDVCRADVDLWTGTLDHALASSGGYLAGSNALLEYLKYTLPGFVYEVGLAPPAAAAAKAALELLTSEPERISRLADRARLFRQLALEHGLTVGSESATPIVPIILGNSMRCLNMSQALFEQGVHVQPILYPTVEEREAHLRFVLTASHSKDQIRLAITRFCEQLTKIDSIRHDSVSKHKPDTVSRPS